MELPIVRSYALPSTIRSILMESELCAHCGGVGECFALTSDNKTELVVCEVCRGTGRDSGSIRLRMGVCRGPGHEIVMERAIQSVEEYFNGIQKSGTKKSKT